MQPISRRRVSLLGEITTGKCAFTCFQQNFGSAFYSRLRRQLASFECRQRSGHFREKRVTALAYQIEQALDGAVRVAGRLQTLLYRLDKGTLGLARGEVAMPPVLRQDRLDTDPPRDKRRRDRRSRRYPERAQIRMDVGPQMRYLTIA